MHEAVECSQLPVAGALKVLVEVEAVVVVLSANTVSVRVGVGVGTVGIGFDRRTVSNGSEQIVDELEAGVCPGAECFVHSCRLELADAEIERRFAVDMVDVTAVVGLPLVFGVVAAASGAAQYVHASDGTGKARCMILHS